VLSAETAELLADGVTADEEAIPAEGQKEHAWHAHHAQSRVPKAGSHHEEQA